MNLSGKFNKMDKLNAINLETNQQKHLSVISSFPISTRDMEGIKAWKIAITISISSKSVSLWGAISS